MKKLTLFMTLLLLTLSLTGCAKLRSGVALIGDTVEEMRQLETSPETTAIPRPTPSPVPTPEPTHTPTPSPTPSPTPQPTPEPTPPPITDSFLTGIQQADYLRFPPFSDLANDEQRTAFVKVAAQGVSSSAHAQQDVAAAMESLIYGESANVGYLLQCADRSGLTDAGILNVFPDCDMQYQYLLNVNGFQPLPLGDCVPFGGTESVQPGDLIFWLDESGSAVNYGILSAVTDTYLRTILCKADGTPVSVDMNWSNIGVRCIQNGVVIKLVYPKNEQFVFQFCVNHMRLTPAVACGIMANIYKESSFRNYIEAGGSYGLCQWLGERRSTLMSWCRDNGLDYTTLYGQLCFMYHELSYEAYTPLVNILYSLGNTPEDAAKAAREWCYKFEQPANAGTIGYDRGQSAKNDFFPIYAQYGN